MPTEPCIPPAYHEEGSEELRSLIQAARLGLLACSGPDGLPAPSHLPLPLYAGEGPQGTLYGHLARANPQLAALRRAGRVVAVFTGAED